MAEEKLDVTQVRQEVINVLSDPYAIPPEFKTWLYQTMGRGDYPIPYSAVQSLHFDGIGCKISRAAAQSIPNTAWTTVTTNTEDFDRPGGMADTTAGCIVIPSRGLYIISIRAFYTDNATGFRAIQPAINGTRLDDSGGGLFPAEGSTSTRPFFVNMELLSRSDVITIQTFQTSGANLAINNTVLGVFGIGNVITNR